MANRVHWLRLIWRLCILAILCGAAAYLWDGSKARADSGTYCAQCDWNNATAQADCQSQYNNCIQGCNSSTDPNCSTNCANAYSTCRQNGWTSYDNCLYGSTDFSGICTVNYGGSGQTYSGRGKTQCDYACRDAMYDCRDNGGETCGEDFESCKLGCG